MKRIAYILSFFFFTGIFFGSLNIDEARFKLGEKLYNQKNYVEASSELDDLITKYPYSQFYQKSLLLAAKSFYALESYQKALDRYSALEKNARKTSDMRVASYGKGECYYKMKNWKDAGDAFVNFALLYKDSPARPGALYFAAKSLEALNMPKEALGLYQNIIQGYPGCPFYNEALEKAALLSAGTKKVPDTAVNPIANTSVVITNIVTITNTETSLTDFYQPAFLTNIFTNIIEMSNTVAVTQSVTIMDTNDAEYNKALDEMKRKQEEVDRYKALIELKAKFLDMKARVIKEKTDYIANTKE